MRVLYSCDYSLNTKGGKNRATLQKINALSKKIEYLHVIANKFDSGFFKYIYILLIEFKLIYNACFLKYDVFISRGYVGFISGKIFRLKGTLTVREVHSNLVEEAYLLRTGLALKGSLFLIKIANHSDFYSDIRIFNHPDLLRWYKDGYKDSSKDFYCYNGFGLSNKPTQDCIEEIDSKLNNVKDKKIICFTGSASIWHGVDYLVNLQSEFNENDCPYQIVCGGGEISKQLDPEKLLINITPLDESGCAELIKASDVCILPVKLNRVSPGSPLKLYDYFSFHKPVITQDGILGYSDEVKAYGNGISIDFNDIKVSCLKVDSYMKQLNNGVTLVDNEPFSWDSRMKIWRTHFNKYLN